MFPNYYVANINLLLIAVIVTLTKMVIIPYAIRTIFRVRMCGSVLLGQFL